MAVKATVTSSATYLILSYSFLECVVVSCVVCELPLGQPDDVRAHTVQEILTASRSSNITHKVRLDG